MQHDNSLRSKLMAYQVFTELPQIRALASEWDCLLDRSNCNRAFSSSSWFIATCRLNPNFQPYVVIARRGAALVGILPLVLSEDSQTATFPNYLTDYSDVIAASNDFAAVADLLNYARFALNHTRIVLSNIRRDSNCLRAIGIMGSTHRPFREVGLCYYLRLPTSHDDFLRSKGSRFRKRLKRLQCCAEKRNLLVRALNPDSFAPNELPEVFLSLHLQRRKSKSCFETTAAQSFVEEVIPSLFRAGVIQACALVDGERIVAIDLYTAGRNSLCAWNGGFLTEAEDCSPGKLLINAGIKLACALKLEEYDFMRGAEVYKSSWANNCRSIGELEFGAALDPELKWI